jgi:excisionase family DNA binding protein
MERPIRTAVTIMMTAEELAKRWAVHVKTIHSAIQDKQLPAIRFHRIYRIPRAAVEAFEARGGYVLPTGEATVTPEAPHGQFEKPPETARALAR